MAKAGKNYYLVGMRFENWTINKRSGFTELGFKKRRLPTISQMKPGDRIIIYLASQISCLAGVCKVTKEVYESKGLKWDDFFNYRIGVRSVKLLEEKDFVDFRQIITKLNFIKNKSSWRAYVRLSLRKLSLHDFNILNTALGSNKNRLQDKLILGRLKSLKRIASTTTTY